MSVQINTYVLFGVLLPYTICKEHYDALEPYTDNAFEPSFNPKNDLTVLYDGMNGDYVMIGHVVAKSENYRFFVKPISLVDHWGVDHDGDKEGAVIKLLESIGISPSQGKWGWHIVSHYR